LEYIKLPKTSVKPYQFISNDVNFESISMGSYRDFIYYAKIGFPHSKTPLKVLLDTGSNEFWLVSDQCDSSFCEGRNFYPVGSFAETFEFLRVRYFSGIIEGFGVADSIFLGPLRAQCQDFIAATYVDIENVWDFDGIIGMGPKRESMAFGRPTFVENLYLQEQIPNAIFTFLFAPKASKRKSQLIIGGIDRKKYKGHLHWLQNESRSFWQVPLLKFNVDDFQHSGYDNILFDSGTPYIVCPHEILLEINDVLDAVPVENTGYFAVPNILGVPCQSGLMGPKITFEIGTRNGSTGSFMIFLYPEDYLYEEDGICYTIFTSHPEWTHHPDFKNRWVMGAHFMKIYYLAFDLETDQIGIAPLRNV
jgi:hypothetical protein